MPYTINAFTGQMDATGSGGGSGDVTGPDSSTDNAVARFDGTAGTSIQNSGVIIDNSNNVSGVANLTVATGGAVRTATSATNTVLLQAYDVDGAAYTTFLTLTANNTPTCDLSTAVTISGNAIYYATGTDIPVTDGGTGASDAATARTNLGVAIGSDVQGYDATLASIATNTGTAANKAIYFTALDTAAEFDLTAAGRAILDDANAAAQRTTLGVAIGSDVQAYDATLASIATNTGSAANKAIYFTALDTAAEFDLTAAGRAILDDANAAAQRTTLGLAIGSDVQAYDATLAAWAAYNTNGLLTQTAADTFTGRTITGTANQITVSNGDGVAGNPTLSTPQDIGTSSNVTFGNVTLATGGALRSATGAGNTALLQAYDVDGAAYTTFLTLTANNSPTCDLSTSVTMGSNAIYYATGTDIPVTDGGTGASDAATARTNLGVAIGSDVQAYDAALASIAANTGTAADKGIYYTALDTAAEFDLTAAGRAILDDANAAAQRTTLGVAIGSDVQAYDAALASIATNTGTAADKGIYYTALDTAAEFSLTSAGRAILDDANAAAQRTTLGLAIGSDVQAYDAQLADIAALAVTDGNFIVGNGANWVAESGATARTSLGLGTIATQASNSVDIDGGAIDGITLGTNSPVTEARIDNISINGNTILSANANGGILITPNGTGDVVLDGLKWPQADGNASDVLKTDGAGQLSWVAQAGGGDVSGPVASTDNAIARWDGAGGDTLQDSGVTIDDSDNITGIASATIDSTGAVRSATGAGNTMLLQAYDVDGAAYTTFITFTANNSPTCDLSTSVTIGGNAIYYAGGTDVAVADGGTGASDAATARTNLGLGTISTQAANSVDIDGGAVDGITLGTNSAVTEADIDNININGNTIISSDTNGNINITPDGTGDLVLDGLKWPQADGTADQVLKTNGSAQLSWTDSGSGTTVTLFHWTKNGTQTTTSESYVDVTAWDSAVIDTIGVTESTTNGTVTIAAAGTYELQYNCTLSVDLPDEWAGGYTELVKNGTQIKGTEAQIPILDAAATGANGSCTVIASLAQNDVIKMRFRTNDTNVGAIVEPTGTSMTIKKYA